MRPPSYYTSIAQNNDRNSGRMRSSASSYMSNDLITTRTPSQQLRSSFSSSSSSSYVNRSHLPFVPQSTLIAHCFTGVGSSTRPYGTSYSAQSSYRSPNVQSSYLSSSSSSPSSHRVSRRSPAAYMSGSSGSSSSTSSGYTSSSGYHGSATYLPPRSPYLSSTTSASSGRYRPTTSTLSTYYKPIRLRERPILTQISNRLNASEESLEKSDEQQHSSGREKSIAEEKKTPERSDTDWSQDVARNISRNKYLIKFREFDRSNRSNVVSPLEQQAAASEGTSATTMAPKEEGIDVNEPKSCSETKGENQRAVLEATGDDGKENATNNCDTGGKKKVKKIKKKASGVRATVVAVTDAVAVTAASAAEPDNLVVRTPEIASEQQSVVPEIIDTAPKQQEAQKDKKADIEMGRADRIEREGEANKCAAVKKERRNVKIKLKPIGAKQVEGSQLDETQGSPKTPTKTRRLVKKASLGLSKKAEASAVGDGEKKLVQDSIAKRKSSSGCDKLKVDTKVAAMVRSKDGQRSGLSDTSSTGSAKSARIRFRNYNYDDFNFLTVLGHGGWGFVILAELKDYDACFAVKCIKKITIVEDDDYESIMIERKVLALGNINPFICKLFCTFETDGYLFFVMEYCPGGDLMFHVQREGKFTESRSRFYAAEIICAIRFLHNRHIIYRDLKLDNILLDSKGHIRLVDFGMCQCRTYREEMLPSNFCGTPEYISPEIIKGVPYNHSVDWWSFGVLLYEMAVGKMPFRGNDENELLWNVCYEQIHYPMFLTKELTDLLKLLLEREPTKRMGMATCKAGDIYDQPFFRGVNWKAVEELKVEPPFVPEVVSMRRTTIESDFTESACELSPVDEKTLAKIDQNQFQKFPYTNPDIFIFEQQSQ